jgi:EmrB/QacA subfamily drug resistance transporter
VTAAGAFMAFLDATIVNIAFPSIAHSFPETSRSGLSWVLNAYNIVFAALLVPFGRLADLVGRRRLFLGGLALFTGASMVCAAAQSPAMLVAARIVQAVGAAALIPTSIAFLLAEFPAEQRATAVGLWGAAAAFAAAIGPSLGGLLIDADSWRLVFLVNVPIGAFALLYGRWLLTESETRSDALLPDFGGSLLIVGVVGALALAIVEGPSWGWSDIRILGAFAIAAALTPIFLWRCRRHPAPVIALSLFRSRSLSVANVGTMLFSAAFFGMLLVHVLFLTSVWRYSVLRAGLAMSPAPLMAAAVAGPAGRVADRFGQRVVAAPGALLFALGNLWFATRVGVSPHFLADWLPGAILTGLGVGLCYPALGSAAVAELPAGSFAAGSALNSVFRQVGAVLGVSLVIAIVGTPTVAGALHAFRGGWTFAAIGGAAALVACLALGRVRAHLGDQPIELRLHSAEAPSRAPSLGVGVAYRPLDD